MSVSDAECLEHLWRTRYSPDGVHATCPKCNQRRVFKRYKTSQRRQSWTCTGCGHHVHPTAGTPFEGSSVSLAGWFEAIAILGKTPEITTSELARKVGVNRKTALRMRRRLAT